MIPNEFIAPTIDHALTHTFISTKPIWFDEQDDGQKFFPHIPIGTIFIIEAVIFTMFTVDVRASYSGSDENIEFDIEYLATHCEVRGPLNISDFHPKDQILP